MSWPRGKGKTTLSQGAALWAILYGLRRFVVLVCADKPAADDLLGSLKSELAANDKLAEDFPEVCSPVRALEGKSQRCDSQTYSGKHTGIKWKTDKLVMPDIPGSACSGSVVLAKGITGGIKGLRHKAGGKYIRPDFALLDDPQTRESATSAMQTATREHIILGDVLGLAGHDKQIAAVMNITYICSGDLADRFLDHEQHPEWQGERGKLVDKWPDDEKAWGRYAELWRRDKLDGTDEARKFYRKNRRAMDKGAEIDDPQLYDHATEQSAIHHAYNLLLSLGRHDFMAEYQGEPQEETSTELYRVERGDVIEKTNGLDRRQSHPDEVYLVAGIDINHYAMSWCVMSIQRNLGAHVVEYGFYPGGNDDLWNQRKKETLEQAVYNGMFTLSERLGGAFPHLATVAFDGNFETGTVYRAAKNLNRTMPFRVVTARGRSAEQYNLPQRRSSIQRIGHRCHVFYGPNGLTLTFDSHYWHRHLQMGFLLNPGAPGSVSLWGSAKDAHGVFADHVVAEKLLSIEIRHGRESYKWHMRRNEKNDLADAAVMALVCAAAEGANPNADSEESTKAQKKPGKGITRISI